MGQDTLIVVIVAAVAAAALLLAASAHRRLSATRRSLSILQGTFEGSTLVDAVATYIQQVRGIDDNTRALSAKQEELFNRLSRSPRNVGLVRYDAFDDMGGQMSFSVAILNDHGDGVVLTSINGRTEARTYAKAVEVGESDHNLSPEEQKAISEALSHRAKAWR